MLQSQLPPQHLESISQHVAKANAAGFYASDNVIIPVQIPLKVADDSINYILIAGRLAPVVGRGSRAVPADGLRELTMGQSMVTVASTRFRLVANVLVHCTTAGARTELQEIFGTQPFHTWLALLDNPDLPSLVLEPVHRLQNIADATQREIESFRGPMHGVSRGTAWLHTLCKGAQDGSVDGVDKVLSLQDVTKVARAIERQATAAAKVAEAASRTRIAAEKRAERKAKTDKVKADKAETDKVKAATRADADKVKAEVGKAEAHKGVAKASGKAAVDAVGKAAVSPGGISSEAAVSPNGSEAAVSPNGIGSEAAVSPIPIGAHCWYTPVRARAVPL